MSFTDVMYGGLGQVNNQFQANLGQNAAMNQQNQYAAQQQQASAAAQQAQLAALYGPQGFGGQTAAYAAAGAAAGRNTGGFGGYGGMNDPMSPVGGYNSIDQNDPGNIALYYQIMQGGSPYGAYPSAATNDPMSIYGYGLTGQGGYTAPSADPWAGIYSGGGYQMPPFQMPQSQAEPQVDWSAYFNQLSAPQSPYAGNSGALAPGAGNAAAFWALMGGGIPAAAPSPQATLGYDPSTLYQNAMGYPGGGASSYFNPASYGSFGMGFPAQTQQNSELYYQILAAGGDTSWLGAGGANNSYNPFGQINSGFVGAQPEWYFGGPSAAPYNDAAGLGPVTNWNSYFSADPAADFGSRFGGGFDPNSFANRFGAGGYYNPGTPAQISGVQPGGYDPLSGAQPPYTYQPGFVQGMGGPGDWVRQQIPGMQTLSPNDMTYQPATLVNGNAGG